MRIVKGYRLPFHTVPFQTQEPVEHTFLGVEETAVNDAVSKLLRIGAVEEVNDCDGQFVSNIFVVPKPDKTYRLIINLKPLNQFIQNEHFKMEDYRTVMNLMQKIHSLVALTSKTLTT